MPERYKGFNVCDVMSDFEIFYGEVKYKVDFFDPMIGTTFVGFFEGSWANIEVEHYLCDRDYIYSSYKEARSKPHYVVESFIGSYFNTRKTLKTIRYYNEQQDSGNSKDTQRDTEVAGIY